MRVSPVILALLASSCLYAQTTPRTWTMEECIDYALEHNIDIKKQDIQVSNMKIGLSESRWAYTPTISAGSSYSLSSGRVLDQTTYDFVENVMFGSSSTSVSGSTTLFAGFRNYFALKRSQTSLKASLADLESLRSNIEISVMTAYLQVLCTHENLVSAQETASLLETQIEKVTAWVELGRVTEADLLQIKSQHFAALNDVASAEGQYQLAKMELCQLLELDDYTSFIAAPIEIDGTASMELFPASDSISVYSRPEYRSAELQTDVARWNLSLARASYYPTLSLSAGYGTSYSAARQRAIQNPDGTYRYEAYPFFQQYLDNGSSYLSLSLSVPIFAGMSIRNNVKRMKNAYLTAQYELLTVKKKLSKDYEQALIEYRTSFQQYQTAKEQLSYAQEAARQITEKYNLGKVDFTTWNTTMTELAKAKYALNNSTYVNEVAKRRILILQNL